MYNAQSGSGPLYVLDASDKVVSGAPTGRWLLTSTIEVYDGVTLFVHGTSAGGDADVLRIQVCTYVWPIPQDWNQSLYVCIYVRMVRASRSGVICTVCMDVGRSTWLDFSSLYLCGLGFGLGLIFLFFACVALVA